MFGAKINEAPAVIDEDPMLRANEEFTSLILSQAGWTQIGEALVRAIRLEGGMLSICVA